MSKRLELHEILCKILNSRNVYFQPPESIKMSYPAIVYSRNGIDNKHGDNLVYIQVYSYTVIFISKNPDDECVRKIANLPKCRHLRNYKADNLNHDVFLIYY